MIEDNKEFIIIEIGTIAYLIINQFSDLILEENNLEIQEDDFLNELSYVAKKVFLKKITPEKPHVFTNVFHFFGIVAGVTLKFLKNSKYI